jgi:hypothetical protein
VNAENEDRCGFSLLLVLNEGWLHIECAVRLVVESVSAHCRDTALHLASRDGHTGSVKALLEKGADMNAENDSAKTAFHVAEDRRAFIAAGEVRCVRANYRRAKPGHTVGGATRMIHVVLQAAFAAKVRRPSACLAPSVPAARSTTVVFGGRCLARLRLLRTWRALFGTPAGRGEAAVCAARAQGGAAAVRCGPRFGVRLEGRWRAERRLVGSVQRSRTGCCSLRPRRTGRKCRRATVWAHGQRPALRFFGRIVWVAPPVGLGRSRHLRVREGRRGAGAAAVECSSRHSRLGWVRTRHASYRPRRAVLSIAGVPTACKDERRVWGR